MSFYTSIFSGKKFLKISIVIAILMIIVQFIALEHYAREKIVLIDKQTKSLLESHNYKLALLGTSHTNYGKEMNKINHKMFDYGSSYTYPIVMYQKIKMLINLNPKLKYLLIEADYHQFYEYSFTEGTIYTKYAFLLQDMKTGYEDLFYSLNKEIAPTLHKRIIQKIQQSGEAAILKIDTQQEREKNWSKLTQPQRDAKNTSRYNSFKFSNNKKMNKYSVDYYQKTIELAQKNNIEVILIRNPLSNEYLNNMYPKMKTDVNRLIDKLSKKYNLKKFDYRYIFKDKQNLFANMDHLNKNGIQKFAKILTNDIITKTNFDISPIE
jgi:arsenate reductase-like glutaredoxin family protein